MRYVEVFVLGQVLLTWLAVRRGINVIVAQSPYEGFIAALVAKSLRRLGYPVRLVVENHGDFEESLFLQRKMTFSGVYRFCMSRMARFALKHADLLRAVSNSTREQLSVSAPGKKIIQFPTWTDIDAFLLAGMQRKENCEKTIIYAGVLTPLKGVHHLINAFARVADEFSRVQLLIIGKEVHKRYAADLRIQVTDLGLDERVLFIGARSQAELAVFMARAAVLVLPSSSEGLPRVIIEAMAAGTPVIGTHVGGIPELVENGARGFLTPPGDEIALAEKLYVILSNPEKARKMGECGHAFAKTIFSTEQYVRGYQQIFALGGPGV
jgi:glycosyltransferase involved in cell wall biosynthesis